MDYSAEETLEHEEEMEKNRIFKIAVLVTLVLGSLIIVGTICFGIAISRSQEKLVAKAARRFKKSEWWTVILPKLLLLKLLNF